MARLSSVGGGLFQVFRAALDKSDFIPPCVVFDQSAYPVCCRNEHCCCCCHWVTAKLCVVSPSPHGTKGMSEARNITTRMKRMETVSRLRGSLVSGSLLHSGCLPPLPLPRKRKTTTELSLGPIFVFRFYSFLRVDYFPPFVSFVFSICGLFQVFRAALDKSDFIPPCVVFDQSAYPVCCRNEHCCCCCHWVTAKLCVVSPSPHGTKGRSGMKEAVFLHGT